MIPLKMHREGLTLYMLSCSPSNPIINGVFTQQNRDLKFEWLQDNKLLENQKRQTLERTIKDVGAHSISCKVSNSVSFLISEVKHNCTQPGFDLPELIPGIDTLWIIVGGGAGVVLLLIIIIIVCCIRNRRKKRMHVKDEEELRLGWTNVNQQHPPQQHSHTPGQHHHHHHSHHQQQPAGHTGPRQHRSKQPRNQQRPRAPDQPNGQPQPSPRRPVQVSRPADTTDDEKPPPLPQPRKKAPKTPRA
ncbi:T-cell surface antigen CD2-like [Chaetodon trifascialis]|uniref:T-cell surface antigen CD2-like n=1 Tax=Chaetodon trifascialis TaxID=109706 RepID=UPI00399578FC